MHMLQLNPQIPMVTPRGPAQAIMVIDYSEEHDLLWVCALDEGGAIWAFQNKDVRLFANPSMGRRADPEFAAAAKPAAAPPARSASPDYRTIAGGGARKLSVGDLGRMRSGSILGPLTETDDENFPIGMRIRHPEDKDAIQFFWEFSGRNDGPIRDCDIVEIIPPAAPEA